MTSSKKGDVPQKYQPRLEDIYFGKNQSLALGRKYSVGMIQYDISNMEYVIFENENDIFIKYNIK